MKDEAKTSTKKSKQRIAKEKEREKIGNTMRREGFLSSPIDGLKLHYRLLMPEKNPRGILLFIHGMAEKKERYDELIDYVLEKGYGALSYDHRGHGRSVKSEADYGFFYTNDTFALVKDLLAVVTLIKRDYTDLSLFLFGHSMGSLVVRVFLQEYDSLVEGVILSGAPPHSWAAKGALLLTKLSLWMGGERKINRGLHRMTFAFSERKFRGKNAWLSSLGEEVRRYNEAEDLGFVFTNQGFMHLFSLLDQAGRKKDYQVNHPSLPFLFLAGEEDPIIQSPFHYEELRRFFEEMGYLQTSLCLFPQCRHEVIHDRGREEFFKELGKFLRDHTF